MSQRLPILLAAATFLTAGAATADACPRRSASFSPPAGSLLHDGDAITVGGRALRHLPRGAELILWADDHQIPLRVEGDRWSRLELLPSEPLHVGERYHLVLASDRHPGWTAPAGMPPAWWVAAEPDRRAVFGALFGKLALFGALPFALGFVATRGIIIRRRRRVVESL